MVNKGLSKSKYTKFRQCDKALWLRVYHPELAVEDPQMAARFQAGNEVGDLAMHLFGKSTGSDTTERLNNKHEHCGIHTRRSGGQGPRGCFLTKPFVLR